MASGEPETAIYAIPFDNLTGVPLPNRPGSPMTGPPSIIAGSQHSSTCPSPIRGRECESASPGLSVGHSPYDSDDHVEPAPLNWEVAAEVFERYERKPSKVLDSAVLPELLAQLGVDVSVAAQRAAADRLFTAAANGPVGLLTYRAWWRKVLSPALASAQVEQIPVNPSLSTPQHKPLLHCFSTPERSPSAPGRSVTPPPASPMPDYAECPPLPPPAATCPNTPIGGMPLGDWPSEADDDVEVGPLQYATPIPYTAGLETPATLSESHGLICRPTQPSIGGALGPAASHEPALVPKCQAGPHVLTVQFKYGRQGEFCYFEGMPAGTFMLVAGDRGEDMGMVMDARPIEHKDANGRPSAYRPATQAEAMWWRKDLAEQEREARRLCQDVIHRHGLPMRVVHAEFQFDMRKLTFHFTSRDAHPRFRDALNECYSIWKCRIWFARYSRCAQDVENRRALITQSTPKPAVPAIMHPSMVPQDTPNKLITAPPAPTVRRIVYVVRHTMPDASA